MNKRASAAIRHLRAQGYAVVVLSPEELCGVRPTYLEDVLIERAGDAIDDLADLNEEEEEEASTD